MNRSHSEVQCKGRGHIVIIRSLWNERILIRKVAPVQILYFHCWVWSTTLCKAIYLMPVSICFNMWPASINNGWPIYAWLGIFVLSVCLVGMAPSFRFLQAGTMIRDICITFSQRKTKCCSFVRWSGWSVGSRAEWTAYNFWGKNLFRNWGRDRIRAVNTLSGLRKESAGAC